MYNEFGRFLIIKKVYYGCMAEKAKKPAWVDYAYIVLLGPIVLPAMWFMAYLYPVWETWIKENGDIVKKPYRLILIVPFSILMLLAMIIYHAFHDSFKDAIGNRFGLRLF